MKRALLLCLFLAMVGTAQSPSPRRPGRRAVLHQLSAHLGTAMDHATLKDKDRKKLDQARGTFDSIADLRSLGRVDRDDLRKALNDVKKRGKLFRSEDRKLVEDDLAQAHQIRLDRGAPPQRVRTAPRLHGPRRWPPY